MSASKTNKIKSTDFDKLFDEGKDVDVYLDPKSIKACYPAQRISIDFPKKVIEEVDIEAAKIGVTRTALIKIWVAYQLSKKQHFG